MKKTTKKIRPSYESDEDYIKAVSRINSPHELLEEILYNWNTLNDSYYRNINEALYNCLTKILQTYTCPK